jgi:hypothetical protein
MVAVSARKQFLPMTGCFPFNGFIRAIFHPLNCPSRNGYFTQSLRYAQILILEIFLYIPAVQIFACPRSQFGIFDLTLN